MVISNLSLQEVFKYPFNSILFVLSIPHVCVCSLVVSRGMRDPSGFLPSPMDRYRQILLPTLRLFQVILTSTTVNHQQGAAQVSTEDCFISKFAGDNDLGIFL